MKRLKDLYKKYPYKRLKYIFGKYRIGIGIFPRTLLISTFFSIPVFAISIEAPYEQVARYDRDDVVKAYGREGNCTATILGGKWVISAAHCFNPESVSTVHQGSISITSSYTPFEYTLAMQSGTYKLAPTLDLSIWQANSYLKHQNFMPISDRNIQDNEIIKMYGFGGTGENLNSIEQRGIENWHWGAYLPIVVNSNDIDVCKFEEGVSDDGWCEYVPTNSIHTYDIGKGYAAAGDSGSALINSNGYIMGILRGRPAKNLTGAVFKYHTSSRVSKDEQYEFLESDAISTSTNLMYGNRLSYTPTKRFILDTINGWHYPTWIENVAEGEIVTLKVQSLHSQNVNLFQNIKVEGDVRVDTLAITCHQAERESEEGHTPDNVAPYDVCSIPVSSNGGGGVIYLSDTEMIGVNEWTVGYKINPQANLSNSGGGSGGSLGLYGLIVLFGMGYLRRKFQS